MTKNLVSIKLTDEEVQQVQQAVQTLKSVLDGKLITLKPKEKQRLPKMSDGSIPFVEKALEYTRMNPEFKPPYVDVDELSTDLAAVKVLNAIFQPLAQLVADIESSILTSGSEAYVAALAYYNSVKGAAKSNVPNAKTVADDLSIRFAQKSKTKDESTDAPQS